MASIYNIANYNPSSNTYVKNDIVNCGSCGGVAEDSGRTYYYIGIDNASSSVPRPGNAGGEIGWGGYTTHHSLTKPHFFWDPSYSVTVNSEPKINTLQFGDGYEQNSPEGIDNSPIKINLRFSERDEAETAAILHFLDQREAVESFVYRAPAPYSSNRLFVCRSWDSTFIFHDNHSISASFEEVSS